MSFLCDGSPLGREVWEEGSRTLADRSPSERRDEASPKGWDVIGSLASDRSLAPR